MYHYNLQWFLCVLFLPKTFVLMGSFSSRKVTHEASINIAWRLNIKTLKFNKVHSIDKIWKSLKFLFLHMLYIKSIKRFELPQLNHIKQSPKKANTIFSLEFDHWLKSSFISSSKKVAFICFNKKPFKNDEKMRFISC